MTAVGIDVGKASLDVAIDGAPGVARFANTAAGIGKLIRQLRAVAGRGWWSRRPVATRTRCSMPAAMPDSGLPGSTRARPGILPGPPASWPRPMRSMRGYCACYRACSPFDPRHVSERPRAA